MSKPTTAPDLAVLAARLESALRAMSDRASYQDEQGDLQMHLAEVLREVLPEGYDVVTSTGGRNKPSIVLFGTSFWPDVEVRAVGGRPLLGIEVKYIRPGKSSSKAIAECLGQALVYRQRYPHVIAYILHDGKTNPTQIGEESAFIDRMAEQGICVIVKRRIKMES